MSSSIEKIEIHKYAPELNKIWFIDGSHIPAPWIYTLKEARRECVKKGLYSDS